MPLFLVQFLAACNDNIFKNALIILFTYKIALTSNLSIAALIQIAGGLFILPFVMLTPIAGEIADKFEKSFLIRCTKIAEIMIGLFAIVAFAIESMGFLLTLLFLMGSHSAFFGPLKYSLLPQQLSPDELLAGNSFVEGSTFIAILLGTAIGGVAIVWEHGTFFVPFLVVLTACAGLIISLAIPKAPAGDPNLKVHWNVFATAYKLQRSATRQGKMGVAMYGIAWLWVLASVMFYLLPPIVKSIINGNPYVNTMVLFSFAIGLAIGSLLCNRILKGEINTRYVGISVIILGFLMFDFSWILENYPRSSVILDLTSFLRNPFALHFLLANLFISIAAGFFSVPLYAFVQHRAKAIECARVIAALNVNNAFFMVVASVFAAFTLEKGLSYAQLILIVGALSLVVGFWLHVRLKRD
jgi:MFS family permease